MYLSNSSKQQWRYTVWRMILPQRAAFSSQFFFFLDFVQPYHSNFNSSDITHHMNILSSIYKYICIYGALDMRRPMTNLTRLALCSLIEPELKIPRE